MTDPEPPEGAVRIKSSGTAVKDCRVDAWVKGAWVPLLGVRSFDVRADAHDTGGRVTAHLQIYPERLEVQGELGVLTLETLKAAAGLKREPDPNERVRLPALEESQVLLDRLAIDKPPCGECHLKPGERCDICGAKQADAEDSEEQLKRLGINLEPRGSRRP